MSNRGVIVQAILLEGYILFLSWTKKKPLPFLLFLFVFLCARLAYRLHLEALNSKKDRHENTRIETSGWICFVWRSSVKTTGAQRQQTDGHRASSGRRCSSLPVRRAHPDRLRRRQRAAAAPVAAQLIGEGRSRALATSSGRVRPLGVPQRLIDGRPERNLASDIGRESEPSPASLTTAATVAMLITRRCGLLLGAVVAAVVVCSCEAAPSASKENLKSTEHNASTPSTALMVVPLETLLTPSPHDNATATNETTLTAAHNATTAPPAAANGAGPSKVANTTAHEGDAVLLFGTGSGGEVVKKPQPHAYFFSSWITWREDNYLMSILIPIGCGVAAAVLILCSLACIGCCRRRCRSRNRRKLHRKIDPKTFRKMKAADRIKLLAASSDEEF